MNIFKSMAIGVAGLAMATVATVGVANAWEPTKPVDFIIMAGKGGGADKMARLMQSIVEKENLANRPLVPTNKSGGSGAEALIAAKKSSRSRSHHHGDLELFLHHATASAWHRS